MRVAQIPSTKYYFCVTNDIRCSLGRSDLWPSPVPSLHSLYSGINFHPSKITSRSSPAMGSCPAAFPGKRRTNTIIYDTNDPPDSDPLSFPSLSLARAAPTWGQPLLSTSSKELSSCWWTANQRLLGHGTALK